MDSVLVRKLCLLLSASFVLAACSDPTGPRPAPPGLEIRPIAGSFPVEVIGGRKYVRVTAVIHNDSDRTVYYSYCSEGISEEQAGVWEPVWRPICLQAVLVPPEPIAPGASKQMAIPPIEHSDTPGGYEFPFKYGTRYRVDVVLLLKGDGDRFHVIGGAASTPFTITE